MNVYILEGSSGSWDSYYKFLIGVYDSSELAKEAKERIIGMVKMELSRYSEEEKNRLDALEDEFYENDLPLSEEVQKFVDWRNSDFYDINLYDFKIKEIELNKTNLNFI